MATVDRLEKGAKSSQPVHRGGCVCRRGMAVSLLKARLSSVQPADLQNNNLLLTKDNSLLKTKEKLQNNFTVQNNGTTNRDSPNHNKEEDDDDDDDVEDLATTSLLNKLIRKSLVESTYNVEVLQRDPNSPLYSVKSFEELRLKEKLLEGVYAMGFNRPSKIQEKALPMMLADPPQNLIAQSQSGTGKTAAFALAMLSRVRPEDEYPQCLCLCPTFELALQTGSVVEQMGKFCTDIKVIYAVRGHRPKKGSKITQHIIIGTPGTMLDWCFKLELFDVNQITVFVLDEADVMIGTQGYSDQSVRIQRKLRNDCQKLLFSATFEDSVWSFADRIIPEHNMIRLRKEEMTLTNIRQFFDPCNNKEQKYKALCNIYGSITIAQAIIFCQTRKTARWLSQEMARDGHQVALLSGELEVEQRAAIIHRFRQAKEKVLITTNVCARGIDVEQVSIVVNFDLPMNRDYTLDFETYLHRIGRTGRFGKKGLAVNLVESENTDFITQIEEHFGVKINPLNTSDMDSIEQTV